MTWFDGVLYFGEKLGVLDNAERWLGIRELRNITAHDYSEENLPVLFKRIKMEAPWLIQFA